MEKRRSTHTKKKGETLGAEMVRSVGSRGISVGALLALFVDLGKDEHTLLHFEVPSSVIHLRTYIKKTALWAGGSKFSRSTFQEAQEAIFQRKIRGGYRTKSSAIANTDRKEKQREESGRF